MTAPSSATVAVPSSATGDLLAGGLPIVRLVISCPDRAGIVAAVSGLLNDAGVNIVTSDQYSTTGVEGGRFFMRMQFALPQGLEQSELERRFAETVASHFEMDWRMWRAGQPKRVALLVSRYDHCMLDLLWRWRRGELEADIGLVASNHPDLRSDVESFGLPYHHVPVEKGRKPEAEAQLLELLAGFDLVVLARYMQILSGDFLAALATPVINIHHSFLPAFAGAGPYERAKERGVKLIGATSHYVTEELDAGPIIEQDVIRVTHSDSAPDLVRLGADIERAVLARAVKWHCEDRVLLHGNTTVVF
jgi:formyltetrahydrofolate deformylase